MSDHKDIIERVSAYYTDKLNEFGETPRGVDWNSDAAQQIRFDQILSVLPPTGPFTVNDLGCGYGALFDRLRENAAVTSYVGFDISEAMIEAAKARYAGESAIFVHRLEDLPIADYTVASGIFSVKGPTPSDVWHEYILSTIDILRRHSARGFAFNCLTAYSDADRMRDNLFYADPHEMFNYCRSKFSRNVALLHDYELYEFTIRVRLS